MRVPLRILLIEDDEDDAFLVVRELQSGGYEPEWKRVASAPALGEALDDGEWDLITCDWVMPGFGAEFALKILRERHVDVPVVIVSGQVGEETAVTALKGGAADYVSKHKLVRLVPVVQRELREAEIRRAHRRAEEELRTVQERYARAISAGHVGIWDWNLETNEFYIDPHFKRWLGYEERQIENTTEAWTKHVHPDDFDSIQAAMERHLDGEAPRYEIEHRVLHRDGSLRWVLARGTALGRADGTAHRMTGSVTDITERRRMEEALRQVEGRARESLAELDTIYQTAPIGLALLDRELRYVRINETLAGFNGIPVDDHLGRRIRDVMPKVAERIEPLLRQVIETGEPISKLDIEISTPAFVTPEEFQLDYWPIRDRDGRVVGVSGIVQDITERKRTVETLRRQAQIIDQIHDTVVSTDLDGIITSWNGGAERQFGYTAEEVIGRHISFVYPRAEHRFLQEEVIAPLKKKGSHEVEVHLRRRSGEDFFAHLSLSLLRDSKGVVTGMIGYTMDITERKEMEEELRRVNADLESLVNERTAELGATIRQLDAFGYWVSRGLQEPLREIDEVGKSLLRHGSAALKEERRVDLGRILAATERMTELVGDLLAMYRAARGMVGRQMVHLSALAEEVAADLRRRQPERNVTWKIADGVTASGDPVMLRVLLSSLLGNAWTFTSDREDAQVEFGVEHRGDERVYYVRDNGIGSDRENSAELSERFRDLRAVEDREGSGGLALTTPERIAARHCGRVWAEQDAAEATFYFTLGE